MSSDDAGKQAILNKLKNLPAFLVPPPICCHFIPHDHMPNLIGLALRPYERRIAIILLYCWSLPKLYFQLREFRRRARQRRELETEITRLRQLNEELENHVRRVR